MASVENSASVITDNTRNQVTIIKPKLYNLGWKNFIKSYNIKDLNVVDIDTDPPIDSETVLLSETLTCNSYTKLHLTTTLHKITTSDIDNIKITTTSKLAKNHNGLVIIQEDLNWRYYQHISYNISKTKSVCLFKQTNGFFHPVFYVQLSPSSSVPVVELNGKEIRDPYEKPTETDLILCHHISDKFYKMCNECVYIYEMYHILWDMLLKTIDPGYMIKIFTLYDALSHKYE